MSSPTPPRPRYPISICKNCLKEYPQKRPWQLFCKVKCRNNYHNNSTAPWMGPAKKEAYEALEKLVQLIKSMK